MIPLNQQPVEKQHLDPNGSLEIHSIFPTIQGEGPWSGIPCVFLRTFGCNLTCQKCFHSGTLIRMADYTTQQISKIRMGDSVLSYDETTGSFVPRLVTKIISSQVNEIYRVDNGANSLTFVTGDHPFLVRDKGWIAAKNLIKGDHVIHLSQSEFMGLHNPMKDQSTVVKMITTTNERGGFQNKWRNIPEERKQILKQNASERMIKNNPMKNPETAIKGFLNRHDRGKLTLVEKFILEVCNDTNLKFVGDGSLIIDNKCPDFIIEGTNKLIEVWDKTQSLYYNRDYQWKKKRRKTYKNQGFDVLFLEVTPYRNVTKVGSRKPKRRIEMEKEIATIRRLINEYKHNGAEIQSVTRISQELHPRTWARLAGESSKPLTVFNLEVDDTHTYIANTMVVHNCDTDYTSKRKVMTVPEIEKEISKYGLIYVVLTGGEPLRQNVIPLIDTLQDKYNFQIETNGTLWIGHNYSLSNCTIVCSPKTPKIHSNMERCRFFKFILQEGKIDPEDGLPTSSLETGLRPFRPDYLKHSRTTTFVQPLDEQDPERNKLNTQAAIDSCMKFGYRLSLQLHKVIGLP